MKRFVLLSIVLHLLLLSGWLRLQPPPPGPSLQTLQLALLPAVRSAPTQQPMARTRPVQVSRQRAHPRLPARHDSAPVTMATDPAIATAATDIPDSAAAAPAAEHMLNEVRRALSAALQANFSYPRRARLHGWEGTVEVALRILPDGTVTDVLVAHSSGIEVLDSAAVHALTALHVPQAVAWLDGQALAMLIPVQYRLTDG